MRSALGLLGVRLASVLALGVSAALLVDYTATLPSFCGVNSGCNAVRHSGYGYLALSNLNIPVPAFGLLGFALLLAASLTPRLQRWVPVVAAVGGAFGFFLLGLQLFKIGRFCSLCTTVDALAVFAAACGIVVWRARAESNDPIGLRWGAWPALATLSLLAPLGWPQLGPAAAVPAGVLRLYQTGKINVVEFADYECPYCRALHPELSAIIDSYPAKVHFKSLNLPLKSHPFAHGAALAQVCARDQGQGDAMANRLFSAEDLRPEANRALAKELGLDLVAYDQCLRAGEAERVIEAESKILLDAGLQGLPTTYVGAKTIIGAQPEEVFRDAFDRAERGEDDRGIPTLAYWLGALGMASAICWVGRRRRATL